MKRVKSLAVGFVVTVSLTTNVFAGFLTNVQKSVSEQETDKESEIAVTICDENFPTEKRAVFLVYETVADIGRQLGYVVQNNNPELSFNDNLQNIGMCHLYLTYYGETTKEAARDTLEGYTDDLLDALFEAFPDVEFEKIAVSWNVPAVDEDNLYAASYWCEEDADDNGVLDRGDGTGIIYN